MAAAFRISPVLDPESMPERADVARSLRQSDPLAREVIEDFLRTTAGFTAVVTAIVSAVVLLQ
jgi:hypothetical protein